MSWYEFCNLLSGLDYKTPLGKIISIRAEKDKNVIKNFSQEEKRIRYEWKKKQEDKDIANFDKAAYDRSMNGLKNTFMKMSKIKEKEKV